MFATVEGLYRDGKVELSENPPGIAQSPVLITFLHRLPPGELPEMPNSGSAEDTGAPDTSGLYVPVRRLVIFLEASLYAGMQWVVFEPNGELLWAQLRLQIGSFLQNLFTQGAFAGTTPEQAYFVKCDSENNPPSTVALGVVNIEVGFAPLYPAEFVVIQIQQMAVGQTATEEQHP